MSIIASPPDPRRLPDQRVPRRAVLLKNTLLVAAVVALLLATLLTAGNRFWRDILRSEIDARLTSVAESRRIIVQARLALYRERAVLNTDRGEFRSYLGQLAEGNVSAKDLPYCEHSLRRIVADGHTVSAMLIDPDGRVVVAHDRADVGKSFATDDVFKSGLREVRIGAPRRVGARFEMRVAAPVHAFTTGEPICGALLLEIEAGELANALRDTTGLGKSGEVLLGTADGGTIRTFFPARFRDSPITIPRVAAQAAIPITDGRTELLHGRDYRGVPVLAVNRAVGYGDWELVAKMDEAEAYAPIARALRYGLGLCAVIGFIGIAAAFGVARQGLAANRWSDEERLRCTLGKITRLCAGVAVLIGLSVVAGWALKIDALKSVLPGLASMKPNTALCFIFAGAALALEQQRGGRMVCAGAVILIAGISLLQDLSGQDFGIDRMLLRAGPDAYQTAHPGRMSDATAINFVLIGTALLLLKARRVAWRRTMEAVASIVGAVGLFAIIGYAYGVEEIDRLPGFRSMAMHTAATFILLAVGLLSVRRDGLAGSFASAGLGGQIARRFLPLVIVAPLVIGWLVLMAGQAGIFTATQQTAVFSAAMVLVLAVLVWRNARSLDAADVERSEAERALRESEEHIRSIGDSLPGGAIYRFGLRPDGSQFFTHFSTGIERSTGYPPEVLFAHPEKTFDNIIPEDIAAMDRATQESAATLSPFDHAFRRRIAATGEVRWFHSRSMPHRLPDRTIVWDGVEFDVTEKQHAENALRESEERLRTVINLVPHFIFAKDAAGRFIFVNRALAEALGLQPETMVGRVDAELLPHVAEMEKFRSDDLEVIATGQAKFVADEPHTDAHGRRRFLQTIKVPFALPGGGARGVLGVSVDISERKRAQEELQMLNQKLESRVAERTADLETAVEKIAAENIERRQAEKRVRELNAQLSARVEELATVNAELESFGYTVSHDLRAPLRHISGFIRLVADGAADKLGPETAAYLPLIANAAERMGQLIDDLLRFSRLGRTSLHRGEVDLRPLIEEVQATLQPETEGRAIEWKVGPLPAVRGDRAMLRQVLANLIGNAVKFTRRQAMTAIEISCESAATEHVFRVRDNGAGFDPQYADKLFGVFQRLHTAQEFEGTGIGLATVRRIIMRHGGRTWAESKPGHGADFFFSLPKD